MPEHKEPKVMLIMMETVETRHTFEGTELVPVLMVYTATEKLAAMVERRRPIPHEIVYDQRRA